MQIVRDLTHFKTKGSVVLTQGTFDGVHLGHQKILSRMVQRAEELKGDSVILTFYPHPRLVLYPDDNELKLITSLEEKAQLMENFGIDTLVVLPFTKELSRISPSTYIHDILIEALQVHTFIIGYDHRFGRNREGSISDLRRAQNDHSFALEEISEKDVDNCIISSTKIRTAVLDGDMPLAQRFLGRYFNLTGNVVSGKQLGRKLGFPTANIVINDLYKIIPGNGVYAGLVEHAGVTYKAMINVGSKPTLNEDVIGIEAHMFNFSEDIYGQEIKILFVDKLREQIKFASVGNLSEQLTKDKSHALEILLLE
ncbi:MAG: riboflavin kinase/FMN adenylyltransferase [Bacteroidia bacterium]|jgi:riboflavin kinase/FMN adenylyltransferase